MNKKVFLSISVAVLVALGIGFIVFYQSYTRGTIYYVQINQEPVSKEPSIDSNGVTREYYYVYELDGVTDEGKSKLISFDAYNPRPLREDAYLAVKISPTDVALSWEEVTEDEIPEAALTVLKNQQ